MITDRLSNDRASGAMLTTRLNKVLGIEAPIIQAPIGQTAEATLAIAVCKAGGLGTLGARAAFPEELRGQIRQIRQHTSAPFGVGFITHLLGPRPLHFAHQQLTPHRHG